MADDEGPFLAIADHFDNSIGGESQGDQEFPGPGGSPIPQSHVVFSGSSFVTMTFDTEADLNPSFRLDLLQPSNIFLQNLLTIRADLVLVVVEEDIIEGPGK